MSITVGVMGSAGDAPGVSNKEALAEKANALALALARKRELVLLTGATTGIVYVVGKAAHDAGIVHVGISPADDRLEHVERYNLPLDACDMIIYTGFGLKGRNVVLVRSCEVVLFIAGSMGSLNEFTIAHDEGKVIGCLTGSGGVADEVDYLLKTFSKNTGARIFQDEDPVKLVDACLNELKKRQQQ
ncbi:MAG TPA: hypothetical protein VGO56_16185 [Pyrinomonadaceae bacterium]|nr:hypothetical protein [Pyrinomonadaceae bacterium]